jgi:NADPH-dependent 2,4-dienoyl-CoA reductase/sulfur reductase-like enzyme
VTTDTRPAWWDLKTVIVDVIVMAPKPTRDGYTWTPESGITSGNLETDAVIVPPRSLSDTAVYDAIVIGAGYAGLLAVRDLALQGTPAHFNPVGY